MTSYTETDPVYTASSWYSTTNNSGNWNTAYGWGNHASAGYLTSLGIGSQTQAWDADLDAIAALSGTSGFLKKTAANTWTLDTNTYLTSYTETDTLNSVTGRGNTTTNSISIGGLTNSGNLTFTGTGNRITGDFSSNTATDRVMFQSSTTNGNTNVSIIPNGTSVTSTFTAFASSNLTNVAFASFGTTAAGDVRITSGNTAAGSYLPMVFATGGAERVRINTSGTVFIGNGETESVPANGILSATGGQGQDTAGANLTIQGGRSTGNASGGSVIFQTSPGGGSGSSSNAAQERMRINSSGEVLIGGASSLSADLGIYGGALGTTAGNQVMLERTNVTSSNVNYIEISEIRTSAGSDWTTSGSRIQRKIDATWHGYIQFGGTGVSEGITFGTGASTVSANSITERMRISAAGGLSVGTTADAGAGGIFATGNITAFYSDERLKNVSGRIENALDKVNSLSGVYYTNNEVANANGYTSTETQVGVLAQQVKDVLPEIVKPAPFDLDENGNSKSGENYMTVQYERLVPLLIEAIKELTAKVEALESK